MLIEKLCFLVFHFDKFRCATQYCATYFFELAIFGHISFIVVIIWKTLYWYIQNDTYRFPWLYLMANESFPLCFIIKYRIFTSYFDFLYGITFYRQIRWRVSYHPSIFYWDQKHWLTRQIRGMFFIWSESWIWWPNWYVRNSFT